MTKTTDAELKVLGYDEVEYGLARRMIAAREALNHLNTVTYSVGGQDVEKLKAAYLAAKAELDAFRARWT